MTKKKKCVDPQTLSALISKGKRSQGVEETNDCTLKAKVLADTLGMALIGKCGSSEEALKIWGEWQKQCRSGNQTYLEKLSELLNIPLEVVKKISRFTYEGVEANDIIKMLHKGEIPF